MVDSHPSLKDMIYRELDAIADSGQLTFECVQVVGELVDILKDLCEVESADMAYEEGYSRDGGYSQRGRMMPRYYEGNSYGGNSYGNRGRGYGGGYSRDDGYSGGYSRDTGKKEMVAKLENLWNEVRDEHDKDAIKRMIDQIK